MLHALHKRKILKASLSFDKMVSNRKSFFNERTLEEIKSLRIQQVSRQKGLVKRILDLDFNEEAIELRVRITPGRFFSNVATSAEASRKCYKHGEMISLSQPQSQEDAYRMNEIPLAIRARDFSRLKGMKEEEVNFIGYTFRPVQGRDRRKRVVPFVWLPEAVRIFGYAENRTQGIVVHPYDDAARVRVEGASILSLVPSRTKKNPRYKIRLEHVPVNGNTERKAIVWSLRSDFEIDSMHSKFNIRYKWELEREASDVFTFYPQAIAAYIATAGTFWKQYNLTPMEMNPFALPSRKETELYKKLCNSVVIFDPTLKSKDKIRKLHLDEKCILLARSIAVQGHDATFFWDPERDGKLKDYDWNIPQS